MSCPLDGRAWGEGAEGPCGPGVGSPACAPLLTAAHSVWRRGPGICGPSGQPSPGRTGTAHSKCFSSRGHKRKLSEEDVASESSRGSSGEDEEGSSSEADEMAAALEAELDLM